MPTTQTPLSAREAAFVRHYLAGRSGVRGNGTQAAIAAGYAPRSAGVQAHALLKRPKIQRAVAARCARADITVDRVLEELRRVAFSDMGDVATWGPEGVELKASAELPDDVAPAVADVIEHRTRRVTTRATPAVGQPGEPSYQPPGEVTTVTEERKTRIKLHDKIAALVHPLQVPRPPEGPERRARAAPVPEGFLRGGGAGRREPDPGLPARGNIAVGRRRGSRELPGRRELGRMILPPPGPSEAVCGPGTALGAPSTGVREAGGRLESPKRTSGQRALSDGRGCASCGRLLTGRQRGACSPRCRARLSRQRRAAAEASRRATEGPWRFRVQPAGRRFGWRGAVFASDRTTGVLEIHDPGFAAALRELAKRDAIMEVPWAT